MLTGSEANAYLAAYSSQSPTVAVEETSPAPVVSQEGPGEQMPETVPDAPKKEGFFRNLFSHGSSLYTMGGLGAALLVLIILYLAIVPVNNSGSTRLELIWSTLRGKTQLNPSAPGPVKQIESAAVSAANSVGSFAGNAVSSIQTNVVDLERWIGGHL